MTMKSKMLNKRRNSKDLVEENEVTSKGLGLPYLMSIGWTDEKHSLYLNSLEASFVKQLYNHKSSTSTTDSVVTSSNHMENQWLHCTSTVDDGGIELPNCQRISTLDSSERIRIHLGSHMATPFEVLETSKKLHACYRRSGHEHSTALDLEVSDQNFVDENEEENHLSCQGSSKRMKTGSSK